jgi:hybrid cluster-associated redox disulfide protein
MSDTPTTYETISRMLVADVLQRWPATADVFNAHAMACVGCALAPFCTILDAAGVYKLPPEQFAAELLAVITAPSPA